ncbi:MAG TPA: DNA-directed RNA polymerase subunit alpha [Roseiflexaceae bacterium]|nr:DNA-directed RNA polymerase subunit alpha [Roseiflexaceae bacterium]
MYELSQPTVAVVQAAENYGRFAIEPLEPNHGQTLGNALRRILLSSVPGAAITRVKIEGVYHEFATVRGVREDVTEVVLNLKGVRMRSYAERPVKLLLTHVGAGTVRAQDIDTPSNVEIVNPYHYICTLDSDDTPLEMELTVERGRGYLPADHREALPIGEIPVDAIFTPVIKVNYVTEAITSGANAPAERLLIEIWTDGTIKSGDALSHAAQVFAQYTRTIASFNRAPELADQPAAGGGLAIPGDIYDTPIEELDLTTRTYNSLRRAEITRVGQLLEKSEKELIAIRNLGQKSLDEIRDKLAERGYEWLQGGGA